MIGREAPMTEMRSTGIITFAAVMLSLAGFFNGIHGLAAIFKKEYFNEAGLLYQNLQVDPGDRAGCAWSSTA
jgi:hypothetical protein